MLLELYILLIDFLHLHLFQNELFGLVQLCINVSNCGSPPPHVIEQSKTLHNEPSPSALDKIESSEAHSKMIQNYR